MAQEQEHRQCEQLFGTLTNPEYLEAVNQWFHPENEEPIFHILLNHSFTALGIRAATDEQTLRDRLNDLAGIGFQEAYNNGVFASRFRVLRKHCAENDWPFANYVTPENSPDGRRNAECGGNAGNGGAGVAAAV